MEIPSLAKTKDIFEGWILSCTQVEQLKILMDIVEEFISFDRYPNAQFEDINTAQIQLYIAIDLQADVIKLLKDENRQNQLQENIPA